VLCEGCRKLFGGLQQSRLPHRTGRSMLKICSCCGGNICVNPTPLLLLFKHRQRCHVPRTCNQLESQVHGRSELKLENFENLGSSESLSSETSKTWKKRAQLQRSADGVYVGQIRPHELVCTILVHYYIQRHCWTRPSYYASSLYLYYSYRSVYLLTLSYY
jgi:hypothetical protein